MYLRRFRLPRLSFSRIPRTGKPGRRNKVKRVLIVACLAALLIWGLIMTVSAHIRPLVSQMAKARVDYLASTAIHDSIMRRITDDQYSYDTLVSFEKDIYGQITALKTNMMAVNRLKSDITLDVLAAIASIGTSELGIPLGNVLDGELLSGRGPAIKVRIVPVGTANATFTNVFTAAGINQTRHQIMMDVSADITVLLPGYTTVTTVTVQVNIAETVIVGTVPDSYLQFGGTQ